MGIEVLEVSWLSRVRQARGAPPLGSLVAFGATTAASTSVGALVHRCWRDGPGLALGGFEFAPGARGRLREVVLSSSGVEASARELCDAARRYHGATSASPGVLRSGAVDFRVQPLSLGTSALVLRTESVADALDREQSFFDDRLAALRDARPARFGVPRLVAHLGDVLGAHIAADAPGLPPRAAWLAGRADAAAPRTGGCGSRGRRRLDDSAAPSPLPTPTPTSLPTLANWTGWNATRAPTAGCGGDEELARGRVPARAAGFAAGPSPS